MSRIKRFDEVDSDSDFAPTPKAPKKFTDLDTDTDTSVVLKEPKKKVDTLSASGSSIAFDMDTGSTSQATKTTVTGQAKPVPASPASPTAAQGQETKPESPTASSALMAKLASVKREKFVDASPPAAVAVESKNTAADSNVSTTVAESQQVPTTTTTILPTTATTAIPPQRAQEVEKPAAPQSQMPAAKSKKSPNSSAPKQPSFVIPSRPQQEDARPIYNSGYSNASDSMASDDSFAEQVLPGSASAERARYSVPPLYYGSQVNQHRQPSVELDASNEVLVKAQLRLEEHRHLNSRGGLAATPARLGYEVGGVHSTPRNSAAGGQNRSPLRITPTPRDRSARSAASGAPGYLSQARNDFSITAASQQQRLQLENERLQKEVSYLTVENQKLRAATISADSSENIKLQLTIDMLRGELEQKEGLHQNELGKLSQENGNLQQKLKSTLEQADSYASSAHQYKSLYEEKQRDLEQLKAQMQNMRYKLEEAEERVRLADSQSKDEVSAAGEKARQLMDILDDVKMQREHVHALNEQLQGELRQAKEDRAKFKAQADKAQQAVLRERELHEKELARVQLDVSTLKEDAKTRERSFEARLREEKKIQESLELRLNESKQEREEEARNYRKIIDDVRNDNKRALNDEAARRAKVEEKARRLETELRDAITRRDDALRAEQEKRIQHYRQEYQNEKRERESAQLVVQRLAEDNARLEEDVQGLHAEVEMLSSNLTLSEEDRARNAQQCELLSNTLSDLMAHDDEQAAAIEELKKALEEALTELQNNTRQSRKSASPQANDVANQQLTAENERLSNECSRLAQQRDSLIEENGNIAQELLKWKNEMKKYIASQ